MQQYKYLVIGGGMAADSAVNGIREVDSSGTLGLISSDSEAPYDRPPLTKGLWKGTPLEKIWRHTDQRNADLHLGRTAILINTQDRTVTTDNQEVFAYEKLLLATGGVPRKLPFGGDDIIYFRTLGDYRRLRALAEKGQRFAVIGGGFIGSELAAALSTNGKEAVVLFPGRGICDRMFPSELSEFMNGYYREKGVQVWNGETATALERRGEQLLLRTRKGREISVDGVVAGVGIKPNLDLALITGLLAADGIVVDRYLRTSQPDIYAAGDVALFYNPALDRHLRVEHEDNANTMGRIAGRNMAGAAEPYDHLPFFYGDLFELGYEAVGEVSSRLSTLADWKEPHREGVIYYQKEGRVRGVLLWNVWNKVDAARQLITSRRPLPSGDIKHKLPIAA